MWSKTKKCRSFKSTEEFSLGAKVLNQTKFFKGNKAKD